MIVVSMLVRRLRRWHNMKTCLVQIVLFAGQGDLTKKLLTFEYDTVQHMSAFMSSVIVSTVHVY